MRLAIDGYEAVWLVVKIRLGKLDLLFRISARTVIITF